MSITRFGFGQYQLTCDICEYMAEAGFLSFEEARAWGRAHGWKVRKEDGEWLNYCPDCAAEAGLTPPLHGNRVDSAAKVNSSVIRNGAAPSSVDSSVLRGAPTGTSVRKAGEARAIDRGQSREVPTVSIPEQERDEDDSFEAALARIQAAEQEFLRSQNGAR